jgi:hypothetical protein
MEVVKVFILAWYENLKKFHPTIRNRLLGRRCLKILDINRYALYTQLVSVKYDTHPNLCPYPPTNFEDFQTILNGSIKF